MTDLFDLLDNDDPGHLRRLAKELSRADALRAKRLRLDGTNLLGLGAVDVGDVIRQALGQHGELLKAARRTLKDPQSTERVTLGSVPIDYTGTFDLVVSKAGIELHAFPVTVGLAITLMEAIGEVHVGVLRRLHCQAVQAKLTLSAAGHTVSTKPARLSPEVAFPLGDGLPLLPPDWN
jgi:hypothetical protein